MKQTTLYQVNSPVCADSSKFREAETADKSRCEWSNTLKVNKQRFITQNAQKKQTAAK